MEIGGSMPFNPAAGTTEDPVMNVRSNVRSSSVISWMHSRNHLRTCSLGAGSLTVIAASNSSQENLATPFSSSWSIWGEKSVSLLRGITSDTPSTNSCSGRWLPSRWRIKVLRYSVKLAADNWMSFPPGINSISQSIPFSMVYVVQKYWHRFSMSSAFISQIFEMDVQYSKSSISKSLKEIGWARINLNKEMEKFAGKEMPCRMQMPIILPNPRKINSLCRDRIGLK